MFAGWTVVSPPRRLGPIDKVECVLEYYTIGCHEQKPAPTRYSKQDLSKIIMNA